MVCGGVFFYKSCLKLIQNRILPTHIFDLFNTAVNNFYIALLNKIPWQLAGLDKQPYTGGKRKKI